MYFAVFQKEKKKINREVGKMDKLEIKVKDDETVKKSKNAFSMDYREN